MKLIYSLVVAGLVAVWSGGSALAADTVYSLHGHPVMKFAMPQGWSLTKGVDVGLARTPNARPPSPRVYSIRPRDAEGVMWTGLWVPEWARNASEFAAYVKKLRPKLLKHVTVTYRTKRVVNGRRITIAAGHGTRNGVKLDIVFAGVQIAPDTLAVVCFIGEPQLFDRYETDLSDMLATVRSAKGAAQ